jgi:SAM-dependent methyltransferase
VKTGVRHLDLECGTGMVATLSTSLGSSVSGVDPSPEMLQIARTRVPNGDFRQADMKSLPFGDHSFDLVTAFNVISFAEDPVQTIREAARVTAPGGRIAITTWGKPDHMEAAELIASYAALMPPTCPYFFGGPFTQSEDDRLHTTALEGGLMPLTVFDVETAWGYPDEDTALRGLSSLPVAGLAIAHSGEEKFAQATKTALAPYRQNDGSYRIGATVRCLIATV